MADDNSGVYDTTHPVLMFHPNLFVARAFGPKGKETGEPKFSANLAFKADHPDLLPLKKLAAAVARAKWSSRPFSELAFPFTDGNKLADKAKTRRKEAEYNRGLVIVPARSKFEPRLAAIVNRQIVEYEGDARLAAKAKFFFGAEVLVQVNLVAYDGVGNNLDGVTAYLNMVLATGKGTRIAGASSAAETFRGYVGAMSAEDPTVGAGSTDDEIPF